MPRPLLLLLLLPTLLVAVSASSCFHQGEKDGHAERQREMQQSRTADEAAIRAACVAWSQAAQARDIDKTVSFYADDAVAFSDRGPLENGKGALRKEWTNLFALPGPGLSFVATDVDVAHAGDMAYAYGTYNFGTADKKGKVSDQKGKFVTIWKKQTDGSWKVAVDIDNSDQ
ncbi:MAG: DUF4440 domain-containing protein [Candidatus Acidiferrales bacterium]